VKEIKDLLYEWIDITEEILNEIKWAYAIEKGFNIFEG
jgi:hypothetical protein